MGSAHGRRDRDHAGRRRPGGAGAPRLPSAAPPALDDGRRDVGDGGGDRGADPAGRAALRRGRPRGGRRTRRPAVRDGGPRRRAGVPVSGEPAVIAHQLRHQLPLLAWLVLVWNLLWGTWSWANLLSGVALALAVTVVLPLPPVVGGARVRPAAFLTFLSVFLVDLVTSGAQVAWLAVRPRGVPRSAIIQVHLRTDSDLLLTIVAEAVSLVAGSLVIDLDRERQALALHLLHVRDLDDVERKRGDVLAL